jgi:hypothetical protein
MRTVKINATMMREFDAGIPANTIPLCHDCGSLMWSANPGYDAVPCEFKILEFKTTGNYPDLIMIKDVGGATFIMHKTRSYVGIGNRTVYVYTSESGVITNSLRRLAIHDEQGSMFKISGNTIYLQIQMTACK